MRVIVSVAGGEVYVDKDDAAMTGGCVMVCVRW